MEANQVVELGGFEAAREHADDAGMIIFEGKVAMTAPNPIAAIRIASRFSSLLPDSQRTKSRHRA